jgi:hypothetical protein
VPNVYDKGCEPGSIWGTINGAPQKCVNE